MAKIPVGIAIVAVILLAGWAAFRLLANQGLNAVQSKKSTMKLVSSAFGDGDMIPGIYSCDGKSTNPPFSISDVPTESKSLAIVAEDPDAPASTFTHWIVWNIPTETREIATGVVPVGAIEGTNSAGKVGFVGPCPPSGTHHYIFTLLALDTTLLLSSKTTKGELETAMSGHILAQTKLTGLYTRQKK